MLGKRFLLTYKMTFHQQSKQGKGIHSTYALKAIHLKLLLIYCHFQQKIPLNGGLESGGYYNSM